MIEPTNIFRIGIVIASMMVAQQITAEPLSGEEIDTRFRVELLELGFANGELPESPKEMDPDNGYVVVDNIVYVSASAGQGRVPTNVHEEDAVKAAKLACIKAINSLRQAAGGDLGQIRKIANARSFTASTASYIGQSTIANGCSDMLIRVFGEKVGRHTRTTLGVTSLAHNVTQKIDIVAFLKTSP